MAVVRGRVETTRMKDAPASLRLPARMSHGQVPAAVVMPLIFAVNNQKVSFNGRIPVVVAEGDEILVAGTIKADGMLHATAYENLTRSVGKTGVLPNLVTTSLYVSSALTIPFFFWAMSRIGADFSQPAFMALALVLIGSALGPILFFRAYNQHMQRDAQELATYARDHLLSRRD